ncbi:hypothetical protein MTO96_007449 [Rhipicephalus appendiculatus]|uniref:Secreted protein n=1 Tax=Rhipicephalus appendiculatus TaxID=34631 RepID=A0A131YRN6_RHIAP
MRKNCDTRPMSATASPWTVWTCALVTLVAGVAAVTAREQDGNIPPSCSWLNAVLEGCSDDSFEFKDIAGWDLLKREYFACLYSRIIQADSRTTCQDDALLSQVQDCRVDAYLKLKPEVKLKSPPFDNSVQLFKNCMDNTLGKFREAGLTALRGFRLGPDSGPPLPPPLAQPLAPFNVKPNITVEYTHFV